MRDSCALSRHTCPMSTDIPDHKRFNHTIKYQRELFARLPDGAQTALDLGCGEGIASRILASAGLRVVGVDIDAPTVARAEAQDTKGITYIVGDFLTTELAQADVVYSGLVLHHVTYVRALSAVRLLLRRVGCCSSSGLRVTRGWICRANLLPPLWTRLSCWSRARGRAAHPARGRRRTPIARWHGRSPISCLEPSTVKTFCGATR